MSSKLAVVFLIVCLTSLALAHNVQIQKTVVAQSHYAEAQPDNVELQAQFLTVIAEGIFGKVSRFLQAKLNIVLWVKHLLIQGLIKAISLSKYLILHNPTFISDLITLFSDLVRTVVLHLPHFNVPLVAKTLTKTFTKILPAPYGQY